MSDNKQDPTAIVGVHAVTTNRLILLLLTALLGTSGAQTLSLYGVTDTPPVRTNPSMIDSNSQRMFLDIHEKTEALYDWHNVADAEGVKLWYGRTLETTLREILEQNRVQTKLLEKLLRVERQVYHPLPAAQPRPKNPFEHKASGSLR